MSTNRWVRNLISIRLQVGMAYKVPFFISMFVFIFPLLAKVMLWKAIYGGQPAGATMGGFDLKDMVTYYFVFQLVFEISWCYIDVHCVIPDILGGSLTRYLLLPVSYTSYVVTGYFGQIFLPRFLSALVIFPALMVCFRGDISLDLNLTDVVLGTVSVALCCVYFYCFHTCIGFTAFWMESRPPFSEVLASFMGGAIIPIDLMPAWLRHIGAVLPFQYAIYVPVKIIMGKMSTGEALTGLGIQAFWVLAFLLLGKLLWRYGIRRYQAYGG